MILWIPSQSKKSSLCSLLENLCTVIIKQTERIYQTIEKEKTNVVDQNARLLVFLPIQPLNLYL